MFRTISKWWRSGGEYRRAHNAAFAPFKQADADGVTALQRRMMSELSSIIPAASYLRAHHPDGTTLEADIPGTKQRLHLFPAEAAISLDTSKLGSYAHYVPHEEWDYRTPEELINAVVRDVKNAV
jgi:hypothetical protein